MIPGVIRVSQLLSVILVIAGVVYLAVMHRKEPKLKIYEGRYSLKKKEAPAAEENSDGAEKGAVIEPANLEPNSAEPGKITEKENTVEDAKKEERK